MKDIWVESHGLWFPQNNLWHANAWSRTRGKKWSARHRHAIKSKWMGVLSPRPYQTTACLLLQSNICFPFKMFYCMHQSNNQLVLNLHVIKSSSTIFKIMEELLCATKLNIQDLLNFEKNDVVGKGRTIQSRKRSGKQRVKRNTPQQLFWGMQWSQMGATFNKRKHIFLNIVHSFNHLLTCKMERSNSYTNLKVIKLTIFKRDI